jgi:hypothetical protein
MAEKVEINRESMLAIWVNGRLMAAVVQEPTNRNQVFFSCLEMGSEEIKNLLETLIGEKPNK